MSNIRGGVRLYGVIQAQPKVTDVFGRSGGEGEPTGMQIVQSMEGWVFVNDCK